MSNDYRQRIFDSYASRGGNAKLAFDVRGAERRAAYLRSLLRGWLPSDKSAAIADLGCGSGAVMFALRSFGYTNVCGVDVSAEQVLLARQHFGNRVQQGNARSFLLDNRESFDLILAIDIIEHLSKAEVLPFLDACRDALREDGHLILQTPNASSPFGMAVRYGDFTHEVGLTPDSLAWIMGLTGFGALEFRECGPRPMAMIGLSRFLAWKVLRVFWLFSSLVETGSVGETILTRVFVARGTRAA